MVLGFFLAVNGKQIHLRLADTFAFQIFTHRVVDVLNFGVALLHVIIKHTVRQTPHNKVAGEVPLSHAHNRYCLGVATSLVEIMTANPHCADDGCTEDDGDDDFRTFHISNSRHIIKV